MQRWLVSLTLLLLGAVGYLVWVAGRIQDQTSVLPELRAHQRGLKMEPATATWQSGGLTITVTTVQDTTSQPPESVQQWAARHRARVDAMLEQFPKDR